MFVVVERRSGPQWNAAAPLDRQSGWRAHATFMDGLVERGFVILGGPLADEDRVVLVIDAGSEQEVRDTLARDPWHGTHLVIDSIDPWRILLDGREPPGR